MCVVCPRDSSAASPHVCLGEGEEEKKGRGKPFLFPPPFTNSLARPPDAVAMAWESSGNCRTHSQAERTEIKHGMLSPKLGKDAIISHHSSLLSPPSLAVAPLVFLKIALNRHPDSI